MITAVVGMMLLFVCYAVFLFRWAFSSSALMKEVENVSPEMHDYLRSFSPYGKKPPFYGSNPGRVSEFVKSDKLNEFAAISQAKQQPLKSSEAFIKAIAIIVMSAVGGGVIISAAIVLLQPR